MIIKYGGHWLKLYKNSRQNKRKTHCVSVRLSFSFEYAYGRYSYKQPVRIYARTHTVIVRNECRSPSFLAPYLCVFECVWAWCIEWWWIMTKVWLVIVSAWDEHVHAFSTFNKHVHFYSSLQILQINWLFGISVFS